jgi:DNA-directed RNA polymerase subunit RPC12/RpoP
MAYPKKLNYECEKCGNDFGIYKTPKYGQKSVMPFLNIRCPECGAKAHQE